MAISYADKFFEHSSAAKKASTKRGKAKKAPARRR
jgi:hypothetical protein